MPHLADDDYIRNFAQMTRRLLKSNLKVYVEHSNEVFNPSYAQAAYAQQKGMELGLSKDPYEAQIRYHSLRSRQIFKIWEEAFDKNRLVRVLGSSMDFPYDEQGRPRGVSAVSETALHFGDDLSHPDALAVAPYFGYEPELEAEFKKMGLDAFMQRLETMVLPELRKMMDQQAEVANRYGVKLIAYE